MRWGISNCLTVKMIIGMRKNYIVPQSEVMRFSSQLMQDVVNIVNHSGGGGFDESEII